MDENTSGQTTLAGILGGGLSGVAAHVITDSAMTDPEARAVAQEDIANFSAILKGLEYETTVRYLNERYTTVGKTVALTLTDPITVSGTLRVQQVTINVRRYVPNATPEFTRRVVARQLFRKLVTLLPKDL